MLSLATVVILFLVVFFTLGSDVHDPLEDDVSLEEAMALLADMSQDDLDVVLKGIGEMMGDDPETIAAIQGILGDIVSTEDPVKSLSEILDREDFEKAITENLDWVNDSDWLKVYQKRHEILEAVIATGELPPEEALRFMEDPSAWETELKKVWDSLQAKTSEEL